MHQFFVNKISLVKKCALLSVFALTLITVKVNAQNLISVPFNNGFVGNNVANNKATSSYYTNSLGWSKVEFAQNSSSNVFVAQGNDIIGMVRITDANGVEHSINGFIKWRAPSGSVTTMVFSPSQTATLATNGSNGSASYVINNTKYIGLTFNGSTLTISGGEVTGNAATNGLLEALNTYLNTQPKISISNNNASVNETAGSVTITVVLNAASASTISANYTTADSTAVAGADYTSQTGTLTFAPGQVSKTVTIPILDDATSESTETIKLIFDHPVNAAIIGGLGLINIIDDESVDAIPPVITGPDGSSNTTTGATSNKSIPENTTFVYTFTANEPVSWSITGGADQSKLSIDPNTGVVSFNTPPNYESPIDSDGNNTYVIIITATDLFGNTITQTLTITVTNVDEVPPVITGPNGASGTTTGANASKSIPENTVNVYTFTANESVTWSITGGADQVKFTIDPNTGALRFVSPPDYENPTDVGADNVYMVVLTATDAAGNTTTQTVAVTVTFVCGGAIYGTGYLSGGAGRDANWKVVALPQGFTPAEAMPYSSYVINPVPPFNFVDRSGYTDANGDTFYWVAPKSDATQLLGGSYNWIIEQTFTVPRTGFYDLNFSGAGDNEIGFYINGSIDSSDPIKPTITGGTQIGSTWNSFTSSTTFSGKAYLTAGVNHAYMVMRDYGGLTTAIISGGSFACTPLLNGPGAGLTSTKTVPENTTDVFTFTSDEPVTWSLTGGEDAAKFSINASGKLVFNTAPDFENPTDGTTSGSNTYIVVVRAFSTLSGLYTEQTVTVQVTDVDETAPIITGPTTGGGTTTGANSATTVPENTVPVYTFTANESVTWSLSGGADQARFTINPTTGLVSFNPGPDFENPSDADANNVYIVIVKATDPAGNFTTQTFTVTVTDVVENLAPTDITLSKANLYEANAIGAVVGNLTAIDPDAGDTHTFSLVNGNGSSGNPSFSIVGNQLKANVIFNYFGQNTYSIRIRTTDAGGLWYEEVFTITISETPTISGTGYQVGVGPTAATSNPVISKGYYSNLSVSGTNIVSYNWTPILTLNAPSSGTPQATPSQTQTYTVTVTNSYGSTTTLTITVTVVEDYNITPRNAITPNGDGKNDTWVVENITSYPNNQVRIFDRAGRLLFVESNYQNGWDGTLNGVPLKEDTYYFVITFGPGVNPKKGFITIVRQK